MLPQSLNFFAMNLLKIHQALILTAIIIITVLLAKCINLQMLCNTENTLV